MADNIIKLRIESGEYEQKLKRAADGLQRFGEEAHQVGKAIDLADKEQANYIRMIGQMETVNRSARGKINELSNAFVELSSQYRHLTDEEKNSPFGEALSSSIEQLKQRVQDGKKELEDINRELNSTSNEGQETGGIMKQLADRFTVNIDAMKLFGLGLKAAGSALDVVKDAFFQSESSMDEWGRTVKSAEAVYDVFLNTLNSGNWSSFFDNLSTAVRGARDLYDALDRLGSVEANNKAAIALVQAEISRLRLLKQAGQDVDEQLKQAISRLSVLRAESVDARKEAGQKMTYETISNRINALYTKEDRRRGVRLSDFDITKAAADLEVNGQAQFDKFEKRYQELNKKAEYQYVTSIGGSITGFSQGITQTGLDFSRLTNSERAEYIIAKAVTEGEAQIQEGLSLYADAITQQVSNATEEFRYNRYTLTGNNGNGGGSVTQQIKVEATESLTELQLLEDQLKTVENSMSGYGKGTDDWKAMNEEAESLRQKIKDINGEGIQLVTTESLSQLQILEDQLSTVMASMKFSDNAEDYAAMTAEANDLQRQIKQLKGEKEKPREVNLSKEVGSIVSGISSIGSSLEQMGITLPEGMKDVLGGIQGVIGVLTTISTIVSAIEAISAADTLIPFARGGVVRAASGFVDGTAYSGDQIPALLNAGELVLNRAQVGNLASQLQDSTRGSNGIARVSGEQIYIAMNAYLRRSGKGELVTWK